MDQYLVFMVINTGLLIIYLALARRSEENHIDSKIDTAAVKTTELRYTSNLRYNIFKENYSFFLSKKANL